MELVCELPQPCDLVLQLMSHADDVIHQRGPPARSCTLGERRGRGRAAEAVEPERSGWDNDQCVGFEAGCKWMFAGYECDI